MYSVKPGPDAIQMTSYLPRRIAGVQDVRSRGPGYFIGSLPARPLADCKGRFQFAVKASKDAAAASHLFWGFIFIRTSRKEGEQSEYQSRLDDWFVERSRNGPASAVEAVENVQLIPD
jgi:hypothetical protein